MSGHCIFQCQKLSVFGRLMKTSHFHRAKRTCTMLTRCWSSHQSNDRHRSVEKGSGWFRGASDTLAAMLRNKARIFKPSKKDGWRRDQGGNVLRQIWDGRGTKEKTAASAGQNLMDSRLNDHQRPCICWVGCTEVPAMCQFETDFTIDISTKCAHYTCTHQGCCRDHINI